MGFQHADDKCVVFASEEHLQQILNACNSAYIHLGLSINPRKTQILYQPKPGDSAAAAVPSLTIGNKALENVDHFPYFGSHLSSKADIQDEIQYRLNCAGAAYGRLRTRVFQNRNIQTDTKLAVYKAVVLRRYTLRLRDLGNLSLPPQSTGEVPPTLPAEPSRHLLGELPHQHQPFPRPRPPASKPPSSKTS